MDVNANPAMSLLGMIGGQATASLATLKQTSQLETELVGALLQGTGALPDDPSRGRTLDTLA